MKNLAKLSEARFPLGKGDIKIAAYVNLKLRGTYEPLRSKMRFATLAWT